MNENPYAPPKATVEDVRQVTAPGACPAQVSNAIKLWAASYCFGLLVLVGYWDHFTSRQTAGSLVLNQLFSLGFSGWLYYKIYRGRNWARIIVLISAILGVLIMTASGTARSLFSEMPLVAKGQIFFSLALNAAVLWLLFFSPGREWFLPKKSSTRSLSPNKTMEPTR